MTTPTFRCLAIAACALTTTVVLVGCGKVSRPDASAPPTASKSATNSPSPTVEPGPKDGTNYQACFGGDCDIAVSRPVTITLSDTPTGAGPFTVRKINAGSVDVRMTLPAGPSLGATIKKGCTATFYGNNADGLATTTCSGKSADILGMYIQQTVTVKDIKDGTAILSLRAE